MKQYSAKVFDDNIMGTTAVYTSAEFNSLLSTADQLSLQAIVDNQPAGTASLGVRLEHSNDGRNWTDATGADVVTVNWSSATTAFAFGSFTGTSVVLGNFVRAKLTLSTGNAHVVLLVTGRGSQ